MRRVGAAVLTGFLACVGCSVEPPGREVGAVRAGLGVPQDGFPSWVERTVHVLTNRARCDPAADLADCDESRCGEKACYEPVRPLAWNHALARAARFHAANLMDVCGGSLQHDSPCDLVANLGDIYEPGPCDGRADCACEPGTARCGYSGTNPRQRIGGRFGGPYQGENIAPGASDPVGVFYLWFHERAPDPTCAFSLANGHRWNILNGRHGSIGVGASGRLVVQDFGAGRAEQGLVAGSHYPRNGPTSTFWANWYHDAAPIEAVLNVEGECRTMELERGSGTNGTYAVEVGGFSGCRRYRFEFRAADGTEYVVPDRGAYTVGCSEDWVPDAPPRCGCTPSCGSRECGDDGCGGSCGSCAGGATCRAGRCEAPPMPDAGSEPDGARPMDGGGGSPDAAPDGRVGPEDAGAPLPDGTISVDRTGTAGVLRPGCACAVGAPADRARRAWWLPLGLLAWLLRRRRAGS